MENNRVDIKKELEEAYLRADELGFFTDSYENRHNDCCFGLHTTIEEFDECINNKYNLSIYE